jgi:hypothetical protein
MHYVHKTIPVPHDSRVTNARITVLLVWRAAVLATESIKLYTQVDVSLDVRGICKKITDGQIMPRGSSKTVRSSLPMPSPI